AAAGCRGVVRARGGEPVFYRATGGGDAGRRSGGRAAGPAGGLAGGAGGPVRGGRPGGAGGASGRGLAAEAVRRGLRQLAEARLLAEAAGPGGHRPRHALLAEAVAADMLPGERVALHERTARLLEAADDGSLAAEAA